jgi:hypothetical protein
MTTPRFALRAVAVLAGAAIAVVLGLTLAGGSHAHSAAKQAVALTESSGSGTMTMISVRNGTTLNASSTQWHGTGVAMTGGTALGSLKEIRLVGGGVYVQQANGAWLHYANASTVPAILAGAAQLARRNVTGTVDQIVALAGGVKGATQPDTSIVYTGTIRNKPAVLAGLIPGNNNDVQLQMTVGSDGTVQEVDLTNGTGTLRVTYSGLGSTPAVTAPARSTDVASPA